MVLTKFIDCKDETIALTMERKFLSKEVLFKINDKAIGYSRNKAINKIVFNDLPMAFFEWYCLMILINYHLFGVEDVNVGDLFINLPDDNLLKVYNSDDELTELTVKYMSEFKHHLMDKLTPELMVLSFYKTVDNPLLNSIFKGTGIIQNNKFTHSKYLNSFILNYYMYSHCIHLIVNGDFTSLNERKELCKFSIGLNKHIKKCSDILIKNIDSKAF